MSGLRARHAFCASKIAEAFDLPEEKTEAFVSSSITEWNSFFSADGPSHLLVYYQPMDRKTEEGEYVPVKGEPRLYLTLGDEEPLRAKGIYFIRTVAGKIDPDKPNTDSAVLTGEIAKEVLSQLETSLVEAYGKHITERTEWGKTDDGVKSELEECMKKASQSVTETRRSLISGLILAPMPADLDLDEWVKNSMMKLKNKKSPLDAEQMTTLKDQLSGWCEQIDAFLAEISALKTPLEEGPRGTLDLWRSKMHKLMSVAEQCKRRDVRTTLTLLNAVARSSADIASLPLAAALRRWKDLDMQVTSAGNEAKDNCKYLSTLEKLIDVLYTGNPPDIIGGLPALLNGIKMVHSIARYFSTPERMTELLERVTLTIIANCKEYVQSVDREVAGDNFWKKDPITLCSRLEDCLRVNEVYQETYRLTKEKLTGKSINRIFDFDERVIFGKLDSFCRRMIKLIDLLTTMGQYRALAEHQVEGFAPLIKEFDTIIGNLIARRHNVMAFHLTDFDRHYVEFNSAVDGLEQKLQVFITASFQNVKSVAEGLLLLAKFESVLKRDTLTAELHAKATALFLAFGEELELVQTMYEEQKHTPPKPRDLPPVSGNIAWSRNLLGRIEMPMRTFEARYPHVFEHKGAKTVVKLYNRVARTLVAYEVLWFSAWKESLSGATAGMQATLLVRHTIDGALYVNFDMEILQVIREAKCLMRMGLEVPPEAGVMASQEAKFKRHFTGLTYLLKNMHTVLNSIIPVSHSLLLPALLDLEARLRPGMVTLTWTSMNIDIYQNHLTQAVRKLEEAVKSVNDVVVHRVEHNLRLIARTELVDIPSDKCFTLDEFVLSQLQHIRHQASRIRSKASEMMRAINDVFEIAHGLTSSQGKGSNDVHSSMASLTEHYDYFCLTSLIYCVKASLNKLRGRLFGGAREDNHSAADRPFFELDVQLQGNQIIVSPSLDDVQAAVNKVAVAIIHSTKQIPDRQADLFAAEDVTEETAEDDEEESKEAELSGTSYFDRVAKSIEIVRVVLLLTGGVQGTRTSIQQTLASFNHFDWLWQCDTDAIQKELGKGTQTASDFEAELLKLEAVDDEINGLPQHIVVGTLGLHTGTIKTQLKQQVSLLKHVYCEALHRRAAAALSQLTDNFRTLQSKLTREPDGLSSIKFLMDTLVEIRELEPMIDQLINPVIDMYSVLEHHMQDIDIDKGEMDQRALLRPTWCKVVERGDAVAIHVASLQGGFRKRLIGDIKVFKADAVAFRQDYQLNGPGVVGLSPSEAVERLRRYEDEFDILTRKRELYADGEVLFALPKSVYPEMDSTGKELQLLGKLYGLYKDVMSRMDEWRTIFWTDVVANIQNMTAEMDSFSSRCKKLPGKLKQWDAYGALTKKIEDAQNILPLLQELSKPSLRPRHWEALEKVFKCSFHVHDAEFKLSALLDANLVDKKDEVLEVTDGADKELQIQHKLEDITAKWAETKFFLSSWKNRGMSIIAGAGAVLEELEESQMNLQTMLTMRNVSIFRDGVQAQLKILSDTSETLELWQKVQMLWCSLESVFVFGDIAKQMPAVAKKFLKVDKDFVNIMTRTQEHPLVVEGCGNEILRMSLPAMYEELERCQKSLDFYLEQKRNNFPRFYFVSNPVLLQILSQGSDPQAIQAYYEKVFDSVSCVTHDKKDKLMITELISREGRAEEIITLRRPVKAAGNIEEWLMDLLREMQLTMKELCQECAVEISIASNELSSLRKFVDNTCGQYALLGLQLMWTSDTEVALAAAKKDKNSVRDASNKALTVLSTLSSWCLQDLGSKMNRTKIETLVTVQVHLRDVLTDLYSLHRAKKISGVEDFEWLKQMRFYWDPEGHDAINDKGLCTVKVTDVPFDYQYEYLGCKERLVITPLTDRCYITLAQAMGMNYGGSPAGPAGTGKTETVKDMGRSIGIYVVVTNCTDQMRYVDCAKIFKGLCMAGLWGCFDEFNRITLPVLSVVAQQILAILNAKKSNAAMFNFPGDTFMVNLNPSFGAFITMNPGYAGRQELPENLKALFRGVAMMVPDREIIMKVKLCSVGYTDFTSLAHKFFVCYQLCEEQLSKQKHYDFGLRNILSVLRTAGATKRENLDADEEMLLYRTVRDMNLSKLVAQDEPLFLSMLADLFPSIASPPKQQYPAIEAAIKTITTDSKLISHPGWVSKIIQLYETNLVRHGIMLVGPAGAGKTKIMEVLQAAIANVESRVIKVLRLNPKAIQAHEMYGQSDPVSGEWIKGVFASIWEKYNNRELPYSTWITCDGPVDAIWIEDLNSVLDDNKLLTLASGDRITMTDNVKIMFETESLANASPATVSRAGIIYVSDTDLDWKPIAEAWINLRPADHQAPLRAIVTKLIGENSTTDTGHLFDFVVRRCSAVIYTTRAAVVMSFLNLMTALLGKFTDDLTVNGVTPYLERIAVYCILWSIGGLLEPDDRQKLEDYIQKLAPESLPPRNPAKPVFELYLDTVSNKVEWVPVKAPAWSYPSGSEKLNFSNLLVPTMDSTRIIHVLDNLHRLRKPVLLVGGSGTAKTSTALMYFRGFDVAKHVVKRLNFSSATLPGGYQESIESELEKRGGKNFGPPNGKKMTVFIDDVSMPSINVWGDQPTNELVRQLIESSGFYFLDKDKRGDFRTCEDLQFVAAMNHPGGGRNDIPNRLKKQFFILNLVLPAIASIDDLYGQMLKGRFPVAEFTAEVSAVAQKLTTATIDLWKAVKSKMLPTPSKFHYIFNMRELSKVFQGILLTPKDTIKTGGQQTPSSNGSVNIIQLWQHECTRVFEDKLTNDPEKAWFRNALADVTLASFGPELTKLAGGEQFFVDFFRNDEYDADETLIAEAPKIFENAGSIEAVRSRVQTFMTEHNVEYPAKKLELVLFDDALRHLMRISRIIAAPRGCALLVGVGGSGKQSLTRLAAYIARQKLFQITLTKSYNTNSLKEDLKVIYRHAGHARKPITFLFTDAEIKDEGFLEYINSILLTGDVAGLFAKDEMMAMTADLQNAFAVERPGIPDTPDNLKQYFIDCVRDNLHVVLCMSPVNAKFPERARKFPGLISGTSIDWFLPWPEEALIAVSKGLLSSFKVEADDTTKEQLMLHMGSVHSMVVKVCHEYFQSNRRHVYQTPKSFLSFLSNYKTVYAQKLAEAQKKEANVNRGLEKLIKGAEDVAKLRITLASEQVKLAKATEDTNKLLASLEIRQKEALVEGQKVAEIRRSCEAEASRIAAEKATCEADLAQAQPIVEKAIKAVDSIKPSDINEIKKVSKPTDIIRVIFDCVLILFTKPLEKVSVTEVTIKKRTFEFIDPSFSLATPVLGDTQFLKSLQNFNRDAVNEETVELLKPYVDMPEFDSVTAKMASAAAEGLCTWCIAMGDYYYASKFVKPKLEALALAEAQLAQAQKELNAAAAKEAEVLAVLAKLKGDFDRQMSEKLTIETNAAALQKKMEQAAALIDGLAGERERWSADSKAFADVKRRLLGDCAVACAFISYAGPFNAHYRDKLINEKFIGDCRHRSVPVSGNVDVISFLVDVGTTGDWNMQGLPTDPLSIQNGILVTRSSRYPLLVDPQNQALSWLRNMEGDRLPREPVIPITHPKLKDTLEFCLSEGRALIVVGVEEEIDPLLDPVLEKAFIQKGRKRFVKLADQEVEVHDEFALYFVTKLPNPHFSPELQAKCAVIDFTVTMKGLEDQLLGRVIAREQAALEKLLSQVLTELNNNTKSLLDLDARLLERLSSNTGNLLDDDELIDVLANTKAKAAEVKEKLLAADETKKNINEKREQFRPVATRGSVLYFSIVDASLINVMYQTSLMQFIELFNKSMTVAEKSNLPSKRVSNIIDSMTYIVYRYMNRGLYEKDKLLFLFLVAVKIMQAAGLLDSSEVTLFMRGGAALDVNTVRRKPLWISMESWLNVVALSQGNAYFESLPDAILRNEPLWRKWYEDNEPEQLPIPDFETSLREHKEIGPWRKTLLIRSLRMDRTMLSARQFLRDSPFLGEKYVEPVIDTIESIYEESTPHVPVTFLLSIGADPTDSLENLAKKKKTSVHCVSMGEGQEPVALKAINAAAVNGTWVLLQNCELGLELMERMEDVIVKMQDMVHSEFRLFLTALPHPKFPLGLLQMSTKVTNEPPAGMRAGLFRSYNTLVDQDKLERIDSTQWRKLIFITCFLHSVVQERRKFGPLGWCIPYEFGSHDASACLLFLERHMYGGQLSWSTIQYMVAEVQYGGKVTDNMDRRLFATYASAWYRDKVLDPSFTYNPAHGITKMPHDFRYIVPDMTDLETYRKYASSFPETDNPEIYGLHPNADLTFRVKEATNMLTTMSETQPKQSGGSGGRSLDDVVLEKAAELLEKLPPDYIEDEYKARIRKLGGLGEPLNIFLFQEIQRFQAVIGRVRAMLGNMQQAIRGEIVMTADLLMSMNDIFDARVPRPWLFTPGGDEFSWLIPTLGMWFASLIERDNQLRTWLNGGRPMHYWMAGFSNPQGFLTAMKQEVTRMHRAQHWALDDVDYFAEVTDMDRGDSVKSAPKEGVYVQGLYIEGARWDKHANSLAESEPKKLYAPMPVVWITAFSKAIHREKMAALGPVYECPVYRYPTRTERYRVLSVGLPTRGHSADHWILRGASLLCITL